jgi:hypothetical protein
MRISATAVGITLAALTTTVIVSASPSIAAVRDPGPQAYIASSWLVKCLDSNKCSKGCSAVLCPRILTDGVRRSISGRRA